MSDQHATKRARTAPVPRTRAPLLAAAAAPMPVAEPAIAALTNEIVAQQVLALRRHIVLQILEFVAAVKERQPRASLSTLLASIVDACRICYGREAMQHAATGVTFEEAQKIVLDLEEAMQRLDDLSDKELPHLFDAVLVENFRSMPMPTEH